MSVTTNGSPSSYDPAAGNALLGVFVSLIALVFYVYYAYNEGLWPFRSAAKDCVVEEGADTTGDTQLNTVASSSSDTGDDLSAATVVAASGIPMVALYVDILRRIYATLPIYVMFLNTINSVESLSAATSVFSYGEDQLNSPTVVYSSPNWSSGQVFTCSNGNAIDVAVACPYTSSGVYITCITLWVIYFVAYAVYILAFTYRFKCNDMRFYIACDKAASSLVSLWLVRFGIVLSVVTTLTAIVYYISNGVTEYITDALIFACVNCYALYGLSQCSFEVLQDMDIDKEFPEFILIRGGEKRLANMYGVLMCTSEIVEDTKAAVLESLAKNDPNVLAKFGHADQLKACLYKLIPIDVEVVVSAQAMEANTAGDMEKVKAEHASADMDGLSKNRASETAWSPASGVIESHLPLSVTLIRRIYATLPIYLMAVNTINSVDTMSAAASTFANTDWGSDSATVGTSSMGMYDVTCSNGDVTNFQIVCPYTANGGYITLMTLWMCYYVAYAVYILAFTYRFKCNDMRFYIACDKAASSLVSLWLVRFGIVLSVVTTLTAIVYYISNGVTEYITDALIFACVNCYALYGLSQCSFEVLQDMDIDKEFPEFILIRGGEKRLANMYGVLMCTSEIVEDTKAAVLESLAKNDPNVLAKFGHADQLKACLYKLIPIDVEVAVSPSSIPVTK